MKETVSGDISNGFSLPQLLPLRIQQFNFSSDSFCKRRKLFILFICIFMCEIGSPSSSKPVLFSDNVFLKHAAHDCSMFELFYWWRQTCRKTEGPKSVGKIHMKINTNSAQKEKGQHIIRFRMQYNHMGLLVLIK